ncbi:cardiolipin synthetase [Perkinsela sp. CCAP 1560/4]|nr:cardiolipin synthetase [Perkinsela sp. CCAP 1560/4]|eukprot:KNH09668.1 cardiolipin synthetase [Perkinsela sp. CCAP 1560/4]
MLFCASPFCLARRPLSSKIRDAIGYVNIKMSKYRENKIHLGIRKRLNERLSRFKVSQGVLTRVQQFRLKWQKRGTPDGIGTPVRWANIASTLHRISPFCQGTDFDVYADTGEAFRLMWDAVDSATKNIRWATYICKNDHVGRETVHRLVNAARRGVTVQFIYDDAGNIGGREELLRPLKNEPNVHVMCFNPVLPRMLRYFTTFRWKTSPGIRNHRKILLVDDAIAFVGGLNIGNEYAGKRCGGSGLYRDTMCRVSGVIVEQIREAFDEIMSTTENSSNRKQVRFARQRERIEKLLKTPGRSFIRSVTEMRKRRLLRKEWQKGLQISENGSGKLTQLLTSNAWMRNYGIQKAYQIVMNRSRHRIWITTPYFLPTRRLLRAVLRAGKRGVDVRIITGSVRTTDPLLMWWGSQYIVHKLLTHNIKLYEYEGEPLPNREKLDMGLERRVRKMHAKTIVVDGVWSAIGSYNLDVLSNKLLEISVASIDYSLASEFESQFKKDMLASRLISQDTFQSRSMLQRVLIVVIYYIGRAIEKVSFWSFSHPEVETTLDESDV